VNFDFQGDSLSWPLEGCEPPLVAAAAAGGGEVGAAAVSVAGGVVLRYALGYTAPRALLVLVNGKAAAHVELASTGGWNLWYVAAL
jgi:hypothetical protein